MPKMRWDCEKQRCFNIERRPKIEIFDDCFPGNIAFGDVDGIVEIDGRVFMLEWKGEGGALKKGQEIMYRRLSKDSGIVIAVVSGSPKTMEVDSFFFFIRGEPTEPSTKGLHDLKRQIRRWVKKSRPQELPVDASLQWMLDYDNKAEEIGEPAYEKDGLKGS